MDSNIDIGKALSSPIKKTRIDKLSQLTGESDLDQEIIAVLKKIEDVPLNITEYRDKERYLEELLKLIRINQDNHTIRDHAISFRYLLGSLYINFEKFWGPSLRVINVFLNESKFHDKLLQILLKHLVETNYIIYNDKPLETGDRPDHILHRNFIYQIMTRFALYIQKHSESFMEQFFTFINHEMLVSPFVENYSRDNLYEYGKADIVSDTCLDEERPQPIQKGKFRKQTSKLSSINSGQTQKRKSKETFLTAVKVIHGFKSMDGVHRADEFKVLLMDFLCCRDDSVQKASFNCLIAYEIKALQPYIANILRILNDKSARSELSMFSIDDSNNHVLEEHRPDLMPILLRILFGKMKSQIGKKSSGRDKADQRKTLVMRFISGCTPDEILYFFGILFDPIYRFVETAYSKLEVDISSCIDLSKYTPLNRFHAMMATMSAYMKSVAHQKEETLKYVFKIINIIIYHVIKPLEDRTILKLSYKSVDSLRVLRRQIFNVVIQFFSSFQYYEFEQVEIDFCFKHLIWPSCEGFIDKNYSTPTPILKLIETLGQNTIYHQFLIKRMPNDREYFLLRYLVELYISPKTKHSMLKIAAPTIRAILIPELISVDGEDVMDLEQPINISSFRDKDAEVPEYDRGSFKLSTEIPFNHEILLSFVPSILDRLKNRCLQFLEKKDAINQLNKDELLILSSLSVYVKDANQCLLGARLLLSAINSIKKNDLILSTLKTCQALVQQAYPVIDHCLIEPIADLLAYQRNFDQRLELCNLLNLIAESDKKIAQCIKSIILLNSNLGDVDAPDLEKMNEGFQIIFTILYNLDQDMMNEPESIRYMLDLCINQIGYIMNNIDKYDFSIRDNCSIFYESLSSKLALIKTDVNSGFANYIIDNVILDKFIKKGLRDTNDMIKHNYIGCLRSMAINCHHINRTLNELNQFCNQNKDADFWLNLKHIQINKRANAMSGLLKDKQLTSLSPKTLSTYFLPIASGFLFTKSYKSFAGLIQNSIKLIGIICKSLNWKLYESTLNYYLGLLTKANTSYQKQNIKVIATILENFNFNLTRCDEAMQNEEENNKLELRMRKRLGPLSDDHERFATAIAAPIPTGKVLNPSTAKMVYNSVTKKILPNLNGCLNEMTRVELEHDKQMSNYVPEKDEIKRIPIAYAVVQLLNLLPGRYVLFREHLPTIFMKLSSFLKSKSENIRKSARDTLIKIMCFLGPAYISDLLRVLKQNLDKGFQIHVLNFTIHSILDKMKLHYGSLDHSADELIDLSLKEIFGKASEDKEVAQILAKTPEAKKTKGYDTLKILCSCISSEKLEKLMDNVKELLKTSNDPKKVNKLSVCLQRIFSGLYLNDQFPLNQMFDFIQNNIKESIPSLKLRQMVEQPEADVVKNGTKFVREDRFLIGKDPARNKMVSKINERGNYHMVLDNCLRLFLSKLEKEKTNIENDPAMIDRMSEFVKILCICLKATSPKCIMRSVKCLYFIAKLKNDVALFRKKCNTIVKRLFIILNLYNGPGLVNGDHLEMVGMCIKTLTVLLLRCEYVQLTEPQVSALLSYIDNSLGDNLDIDSSKQILAFKSLHALVRRRIDSPELKRVMLEVAKLLVRTDDEKLQTICIKVWGIYLLEFNHEPIVLRSHLTHFLRQLDYEHCEGRRSILRLLKVVITRFPEKVLLNYYELMFHLLAQRLVNEDSKDIRRQVGKIIGTLIQRLPNQQNDICNKFILQWGGHESPNIKTLGIKLISIYVESISTIENDKLERILEIIKEGVNQELKTQSITNGQSIDENGGDHDWKEKIPGSIDKLYYHALRLFKRLIIKDICNITEDRFIDQLKSIWQQISSKLMIYWHVPVMMTSCELYLLFIRKIDLLSALNDNQRDGTSNHYLAQNAKIIVRTTCDNFITLLDRVQENDRLLDYITEGLISLGRIVANSEATLKFESQYKKSFTNEKILDHMINMDSQLPSGGFIKEKLPYTITEARRKLDLMWLSTKIVMQARKEVALYRLDSTYRRELTLKWIASILQELGAKRAAPYIVLYLMIPARELTDKGKNKAANKTNPTISLAEDLVKYIRSLINDKFNQLYSKVQLFYTKKRVTRKKEEAILKIKDQERGVKRKLKVRSVKSGKKKRFTKRTAA